MTSANSGRRRAACEGRAAPRGREAARALAGVAAVVAVGVAPAGAFSPYDTTFRALADTALHVEMDPDSQQLGSIRRGAGGIRLSWCDPAIPSQAWQQATAEERRAMLAGRWCEVEANGIVGNVEGGVLAPE